MSSITLKMPATIGDVIEIESGRTGWVAVVTFDGEIVSAVSRYKRDYFRTLREENLLQIGKDQLVIGWE